MRRLKKNTRGLSAIEIIYKKAFTIVEILLTIAILAIVGSVIGYKSYDTLSYYRKSMVRQKFAQELHLAKHLASSYQIDIMLTCKKGKTGWTLSRSFITETKAVPVTLKDYFKKELSLKSLPLENPKRVLNVTYFGNGLVFSSDPIHLEGTEDSRIEIDPEMPLQLRKVSDTQ